MAVIIQISPGLCTTPDSRTVSKCPQFTHLNRWKTSARCRIVLAKFVVDPVGLIETFFISPFKSRYFLLSSL